MLYLDFLSGQFGPWLLDVCLSTPEEETSGEDISYKAPEKRRGMFGQQGQYLSKLISHEEGRGIGFRLHISHMWRRGGIDMVGRKHLQQPEKRKYSFLFIEKWKPVWSYKYCFQAAMQMNAREWNSCDVIKNKKNKKQTKLQSLLGHEFTSQWSLLNNSYLYQNLKMQTDLSDIHFVVFKVTECTVYPYHPSHWCRGVVCVKVGRPPYSLFLDNVCTLVRRGGGHHVIGRVWCVTASTGSRWGVWCNFRGVKRRRSRRQRHSWKRRQNMRNVS